MTEEANSATSRGYTLVGFQVVESEQSVVCLYKQTGPNLTASLVGE